MSDDSRPTLSGLQIQNPANGEWVRLRRSADPGAVLKDGFGTGYQHRLIEEWFEQHPDDEPDDNQPDGVVRLKYRPVSDRLAYLGDRLATVLDDPEMTIEQLRVTATAVVVGLVATVAEMRATT